MLNYVKYLAAYLLLAPFSEVGIAEGSLAQNHLEAQLETVNMDTPNGKTPTSGPSAITEITPPLEAATPSKTVMPQASPRDVVPALPPEDTAGMNDTVPSLPDERAAQSSPEQASSQPPHMPVPAESAVLPDALQQTQTLPPASAPSDGTTILSSPAPSIDHLASSQASIMQQSQKLDQRMQQIQQREDQVLQREHFLQQREQLLQQREQLLQQQAQQLQQSLAQPGVPQPISPESPSLPQRQPEQTNHEFPKVEAEKQDPELIKILERKEQKKRLKKFTEQEANKQFQKNARSQQPQMGSDFYQQNQPTYSQASPALQMPMRENESMRNNGLGANKISMENTRIEENRKAVALAADLEKMVDEDEHGNKKSNHVKDTKAAAPVVVTHSGNPLNKPLGQIQMRN
jgi:hypothetical protein